MLPTQLPATVEWSERPIATAIHPDWVRPGSVWPWHLSRSQVYVTGIGHVPVSVLHLHPWGHWIVWDDDSYIRLHVYDTAEMYKATAVYLSSAGKGSVGQCMRDVMAVAPMYVRHLTAIAAQVYGGRVINAVYKHLLDNHYSEVTACLHYTRVLSTQSMTPGDACMPTHPTGGRMKSDSPPSTPPEGPQSKPRSD